MVDRARNYIILGLGISGASVASFLANRGKVVYVYDDSPEKVSEVVSLIGANKVHTLDLNNYKFSGKDYVVVAPGISAPQSLPSPHPVIQLAKSAGTSTVSALDVFKEVCNCNSRIIGITGSLGKSTVATMVHHIMVGLGVDVALGGNIGIPYFDITPFDAKNKVLELSSYELENSKDPATDVSVITNVFPHHLERHATFERYVDAKLRIASSSSVLVLSADDEGTKDIIIPKVREAFGDEFVSNNVRFFSTNSILPIGTSIFNGTCYTDGEPVLIEIPEHIRQKYNLLNLACAIETSRTCCYVDPSKVSNCLPKINMLEHRNERVCSVGKVHFINDSKSTMHASTAAAIDSLPGNVMLIAGGKVDYGDSDFENTLFFCGRDLMPVLPKVRQIFLIGEVAKHHMLRLGGTAGAGAILGSSGQAANVAGGISSVAREIGGGKSFSLHEKLDSALENAYNLACQHSLESGEDYFILFSPGCQSFDQFNNFMHRGETFKSLARQITDGYGKGV